MAAMSSRSLSFILPLILVAPTFAGETTSTQAALRTLDQAESAA
jgi:hypothetical protein